VVVMDASRIRMRAVRRMPLQRRRHRNDPGASRWNSDELIFIKDINGLIIPRRNDGDCGALVPHRCAGKRVAHLRRISMNKLAVAAIAAMLSLAVAAPAVAEENHE